MKFVKKAILIIVKWKILEIRKKIDAGKGRCERAVVPPFPGIENILFRVDDFSKVIKSYIFQVTETI